MTSTQEVEAMNTAYTALSAIENPQARGAALWWLATRMLDDFRRLEQQVKAGSMQAHGASQAIASKDFPPELQWTGKEVPAKGASGQ